MSTTKARRDGSGSVFKRKSDGRWVAQIRVNDPLSGGSRIIRRYASSRDSAKTLLKQLRSDPAPATRANRAGLSVADYLRTWTTERLPDHEIAPSTKRLYESVILAYAIPTAGTAKLAELDAPLARRWIKKIGQIRKTDTRSAKRREAEPRTMPTIAPSTVRNAYAAIRKALDDAVTDRLIPSNPMELVKRPEVTRPRVPVTSADEVARILVAAEDYRIRPIVHLVAYTGCRIGEALSLRWADVDLDQGHATIRRGSMEREATKTGTIRTVTLLPGVVQQLKTWRRQQRRERLLMGEGWQDTEGLTFTTGSGAPIDRHNATREMKRILRAAGVTDARPWHSLRHGLAHRLIAEGVPLPVVSSLLGHSGIAITSDIYGHADAQIPADVLAEALGQ